MTSVLTCRGAGSARSLRAPPAHSHRLSLGQHGEGRQTNRGAARRSCAGFLGGKDPGVTDTPLAETNHMPDWASTIDISATTLTRWNEVCEKRVSDVGFHQWF